MLTAVVKIRFQLLTLASTKEVGFCVKLLWCISSNLDQSPQLVEERGTQSLFYFWQIQGNQSSTRTTFLSHDLGKMVQKSKYPANEQKSKYPANEQVEMSRKSGEVGLWTSCHNPLVETSVRKVNVFPCK